MNGGKAKEDTRVVYKVDHDHALDNDIIDSQAHLKQQETKHGEWKLPALASLAQQAPVQHGQAQSDPICSSAEWPCIKPRKENSVVYPIWPRDKDRATHELQIEGGQWVKPPQKPEEKTDVQTTSSIPHLYKHLKNTMLGHAEHARLQKEGEQSLKQAEQEAEEDRDSVRQSAMQQMMSNWGANDNLKQQLSDEQINEDHRDRTSDMHNMMHNWLD